MRYLLITLLICISFASTYGQSKRKKKAKQEAAADTQQPNSLSPDAYDKRYESKKKKKNSTAGPTFNSEKDYYDRLAFLEKERRKNERMMDKPQYSDPMYFGHKRPPKKRPANKMKFCKVCGIRH